MKVLVTGGTGLLGNTILRQLSDQGHELIALVRGQVDDKVFDGIKTEFVQGDLSDLPASPRDAAPPRDQSAPSDQSAPRDQSAVSDQSAVGDQSAYSDKSSPVIQAIANCDAVIHSAAMIHIGWHKRDASMRVNRDGTRAIAQACLKHDRKLVLVGTVNTLAVATKTTTATEDTSLDNAGGQVECSYVTSKRASVNEVKQAVGQGLRASIVHPGFMLGPWDWKPSSGRMMVELAKNWTPIAPSGGCSVCDSRDVAAGAIAAIEKGANDGREYILAGHNVTYRQLWDEISDRMNVKAPVMSAGPLQKWIAATVGDLWAAVSKKETDINSAGVKMSSQYHWYDCTRAEQELGYNIRPMNETLDDGAEWIREHHLEG